MIILSIIIPVYNVEDYILRCLNSVFKQMDERIQVIIVDDGSQDKSISIIEDICGSIKNVEIYRKRNGGLSSARNYGLQKAAGRYVYFVDSDDFLVGDTLIGITDKLEQAGDILFALKFVTIESYDQKRCKNGATFKAIPTNDYLKHCRNPITNVWKVIVLKDFILSNGLMFRENVLCEDVEWLTRIMLKIDSLVFADICLYVYDNKRESSLMNTLSAKRIVDLDNNLRIAKEAVDIFGDTERRIQLKRLLFTEWCCNLSDYSRLDKLERRAISFNDGFRADKDLVRFRVYRVLKGLLKVDVLARILYFLRNTRKKLKRLINV
jgi:glycosyltransferase involved in cell wall biosynthesis